MNPMTDLKSIQELLKANYLPFEDLVESKVAFLTKEKNGELIGCIGIEKYDADGLLRSLAVADAHKGKGIGKQLLDELCESSKQEGIHRLHLLTTTADAYFTRYGFNVTERSTAPTAILGTTEFSEICPSSSVYMVKEL
ncbi:GNAT family N-acetyltransferase [Maribacter algicola]|uniref:GNAT family N-acetyltransferase n=1 Tax=Maribacter algicola TaxID=2498892 RepID=A0A3R8QYL4_9FLAO|nr:arsenic resistance N-acetyltransferase ArsN2 [Maribacter algicola]RRQ48165.1 GNAT family N-acetyltransferase [Maribacter algicola]